VVLQGLHELAALRGRVIHSLAFLVVEDGPYYLLARSETGGDVEQLIRVDRRAPSELVHEVPAGGALEEGMHDLGLGYAREFSTALRKASYEVPERLVGLLGARRRSQEFPGCTYVSWKFPTNVRTRSS
jgi:hypothetical protein